MKFKKGSKINVFSKREGSTFAWWSAVVVSCHGQTYIVKYGHSLEEDMGFGLDQVSVKAVRPHPPFFDEPVWAAGDIVEVFDEHAWRPAEILRVGKKRYFVRVLGLGKEMKVPSYDVRIRSSWENNKWVVIKQEFGKTKLCLPTNSAADCHSVVEDDQPPYQFVSKKRHHFEISDDVCKKIRTTEKEGQTWRL